MNEQEFKEISYQVKKECQDKLDEQKTDEVNEMVVEMKDAMKKPQRLSNEDILNLKLAKHTKELAQMSALKAATESKLADVIYRNTVLEIYLKNKLTVNDAVSEDGEITFDGALAQAPNKS